MWTVDKPSDNAVEVYEMCVGVLPDEHLRNGLMAIKGKVENSTRDYVNRAPTGRLDLVAIESEIDNPTSDGLKKLYKLGMLKMGSPGRKVYDEIKMLPSSGSGRCPFCNHENIESLDHILPKSVYPIFSVVPVNLVASCIRCNQKKGSNVPSSACNGVLHPYFENIDECRWLYASVIETDQVVVTFRVERGEGWIDALDARVKNQFRMLDLDKFYSALSSQRMSSIQPNLRKLFECGGAESVKSELRRHFNESYQNIGLNSWQTACFEALKDSEWYCNNVHRLGN